MKTLFTLLTFSLLIPFSFAEEASDTKASSTEEAVTADVTVEINGNDMMKFDKELIEAQAGQTIKVIFNNIGKLPVEAMGHNIVFLKPDTDVQALAVASMTNKDGGYLPADETLKSTILAATKILGPGESETIVFKVEDAGEYPFICSFPGHYTLMKGVLSVK